MSRRDGGRLPAAIVASAVLHAGVVALVWIQASNAASLPKLRVYAVDIVSPPPQEQGEFQPEPTPAESAPEPEPEPEPTPPEPEPEPEPTPAPREPSPAPKPTTRPEPPKPEPKRSEPTREAPPEPKPEPKKAEPAPSRGQRPDPASTGGEDLNVKIEGARFVDPEYLANIQRQINRYFRRPSGSQSDVAEVQFYINRDGSVSEIELVRHTGSFAFRSAAMEAVEQAGLNKAFGPLPREYPADRLLVSFYFRPAR